MHEGLLKEHANQGKTTLYPNGAWEAKDHFAFAPALSGTAATAARALLDGHALCQIARFVNVAAAGDGNVIGQ